MVGSIFEAPMEMFKHRTQAGLIQGRMLNNMSAALRTNGIGALYSGYLAFILKSLPYDVAELVTYSELSRVQGPLQRIPLGCRDVLTGACAGAAAVVASMPADCVKMRIELSGVTPRGGVLPSLALFLGTARAMVRQGGLGALFVGMGPRLADKVPGTVVYWLAVEGCRRALAPYMHLGSQEERDEVDAAKSSPGNHALHLAC
ncbi:hypothetical protein WJX75_006833 [Coccomyxa subellipsoidea]|uniref:Mitochondrial carrier n=1 Tax=Coccomyxa subellipsoidea TaxID=248742 RepID=A0ABR2YWF1_9CHLO